MINVIVAGKQSEFQWLNYSQAREHVDRGVSIWSWASTGGCSPEAGMDNVDIVVGCCGDVPTLEALVAVDVLRYYFPLLGIRFINVVNLLALKPPTTGNECGLSDEEFDAMFTACKPVIFAHHGYPTLIHRLIYKRTNYASFHVRGYNEEGTTTTPFDMCVLNKISRFHLVQLVLDHVVKSCPEKCEQGLVSAVQQAMVSKLGLHYEHIRTVGDDMPEVKDWKWPTYSVETSSSAL
jgi:xylulose-5-phosphate/fructose-6-phosphate phosphoketolase